ncbi:hypothetical protein C8J55DRAFT_507275 [Lentinula edodes]|uniref:Uncharacterized protein n=1 Tax=Lentinula lateritia TaxID=40482 RepID=A0A9W9ARS4_9AGAR|nr:hypothetical protein C8J55DRAFT_507275 [Lentinula edodes]
MGLCKGQSFNPARRHCVVIYLVLLSIWEYQFFFVVANDSNPFNVLLIFARAG